MKFVSWNKVTSKDDFKIEKRNWELEEKKIINEKLCERIHFSYSAFIWSICVNICNWWNWKWKKYMCNTCNAQNVKIEEKK